MPSAASRPARSATPTSICWAAGAARASAMTAVSTASANAAASNPLPASWNEARFSMKPGTLAAVRPARPRPLARRVAAAASGAAARPAAVPARRAAPARRSADPVIGRGCQRCRPLAGRKLRQRCRRFVVPGCRQRHQPRWRVGIGARHHAPHPHALPGPGGLHGRMLARTAATRKAHFAIEFSNTTTKSCG